MVIRFVAFFCSLLFIFAANLNAKQKLDLKSENDKVSYSIGLSIGKNFKQQSMNIVLDVLMQGIEDGISGDAPQMTDQEIKQTMADFRKQMTAKMEVQKKASEGKNLKEGVEFLGKNKKRENVVSLESGLQYEVITKGTGKKPGLDDTVVTHYKGTFINGKEFDSSYKRGQPATFPVKGVIKGWTEALQLMETGSKWKLFIPANLAYGPRGAGNVIGPNSTLIFEIELLEIKPQK